MKFEQRVSHGLVPGVAPHAGAWIEIKLWKLLEKKNLVAPHAGAWIEISQTKREMLAKQTELDDIAETDVKEMLQPQYDQLTYKLRIQNKKYPSIALTMTYRRKPKGSRLPDLNGIRQQWQTAYSNSVKTPMEKADNVGYTKRTKEDFEQTARQIKEEITQYSDRPSK